MPKYLRLRALAVGGSLMLAVSLFSIDYTVKRGDTLSRIAAEQGVSLSDLIETNNIPNPNVIHPGQVLVIPGTEAVSEIVHVVARGDTLGRIAARYGTSVSALAEANGIPNPNLIRVGQRIAVSRSSEGSVESPQSGSDPLVRSGRYTIVERGEGLSDVAAGLGVPASQVARANGIVDGVVYVNSRLFADGPSYTFNGGSGETIYTVQSGDRLGDIASAFGTTISHLATSNNIANPNLIRVGQRLRVPGSAWVCPVNGARFINSWGFPRAGGSRFHEGLDMFVPRDAPIYAPVSGTVKHKTGSIGGKQFNLDGDDGAYYVGSHMSGFGKSGRVNAGDIIGYAGTSGNAGGTSPHLHFAMYLDGVAVNSYPTLLDQGCK